MFIYVKSSYEKYKNKFDYNSRKDKYNFIIINIFIFIMRFLRSYITMKYLDFRDLGIVAIISTILGFFGMLHLGLFNGGYRIFAAQKSNSEEKRINNIVYTYIFGLFVISLFSLLSLIIIDYKFETTYFIILIAIIFGIVTLINNWISIVLSAYMHFREINILELVSTILSVLSIVSIPYIGLTGALISLYSQPLIYLSLAIYKYEYLRPSKFEFSVKSVKWVLSFGFIPFLSGIFVQFHSQLERWSILYYLNLEELGKYSFPSLYIVLFTLVPLSINKIVFPKVILLFSNKEYSKVKKHLTRYILFILLYSVLSVIITYNFMEYVVGIILPKHLISIGYVYYILPGLIFYLLFQPIEILYNAAVRLRPILWAYFFSVIFMAAAIYFGNYMFGFSLISISIIKSLTNIFIFSFLFIYYLSNSDNLWTINLDKERFA